MSPFEAFVRPLPGPRRRTPSARVTPEGRVQLNAAAIALLPLGRRVQYLTARDAGLLALRPADPADRATYAVSPPAAQLSARRVLDHMGRRPSRIQRAPVHLDVDDGGTPVLVLDLAAAVDA